MRCQLHQIFIQCVNAGYKIVLYIQEHNFSRKQQSAQSTKKVDCPARIVVREIITFSEYKVSIELQTCINLFEVNNVLRNFHLNIFVTLFYMFILNTSKYPYKILHLRLLSPSKEVIFGNLMFLFEPLKRFGRYN